MFCCCVCGLAFCVLIACACVLLHVYCTFVYWAVLWRVRVANVHLLYGLLSMLVTAFARLGCCRLPPSPKRRERAAGKSRAAVVCVFACLYVCVCVCVCVGMRFGGQASAASC